MQIITAVIGSGVLWLTFYFGSMGWIGGIIMLCLFAWITWYTSSLVRAPRGQAAGGCRARGGVTQSAA